MVIGLLPGMANDQDRRVVTNSENGKADGIRAWWESGATCYLPDGAQTDESWGCFRALITAFLPSTDWARLSRECPHGLCGLYGRFLSDFGHFETKSGNAQEGV